MKEVASKTNDTAGDGTTTATVLTQALVREGLKNIAAGACGKDGRRRGCDPYRGRYRNRIVKAWWEFCKWGVPTI